MSDLSWGFATRAVHAGGGPDPTTGARAVPIYPSSSSVFEDTADAASLFALQKYETIHSRILDTTVAAFKEQMTSLEGGLAAVATSSGQAAQFLTFAALTDAGEPMPPRSPGVPIWCSSRRCPTPPARSRTSPAWPKWRTSQVRELAVPVRSASRT